MSTNNKSTTASSRFSAVENKFAAVRRVFSADEQRDINYSRG